VVVVVVAWWGGCVMREGEEEARGNWVLWVWEGKGVWVGGDHVGEGDWAEAKLRERQGLDRLLPRPRPRGVVLVPPLHGGETNPCEV